MNQNQSRLSYVEEIGAWAPALQTNRPPASAGAVEVCENFDILKPQTAMESDKLSFGRRVLIARPLDDTPVRVRLRAYAQFSDRLDAELRKLVARWSPAASRRQTSNQQDARKS